MGWGRWPPRASKFKKWASDKLAAADVDKPHVTGKTPSLAARRKRKLRRKRRRAKKEE